MEVTVEVWDGEENAPLVNNFDEIKLNFVFHTSI